MILLNKVRANDAAPIVRAIYCDETEEFLTKLHQDAGQGLEACVKRTVDNIGESRFFRIENEFGALVGFFAIDNINGVDVMPSFHVRPVFRTPDYLAAFWALIRETFNNDFFTSVGAKNYKALQHLLKNNFEIVNNQQYEGKDFIILKTSI